MAVREEKSCECERWQEELNAVRQRIQEENACAREIKGKIEREKAQNNPNKERIAELEDELKRALADLKELKAQEKQLRECLAGCHP